MSFEITFNLCTSLAILSLESKNTIFLFDRATKSGSKSTVALGLIVNDLDKSTPFNSDTSIKDEVITDVTLKVPLSLKYLSG